MVGLEDIGPRVLQPSKRITAAKIISEAWARFPELWEPKLEYPLPKTRFTKEALDEFRSQAKKLSPALEKARKLSHFPNGRYLTTISENYLDTNDAHHIWELRCIVNLLSYDALVQSYYGRFDRAVISIRAMLNTSRCSKDEPLRHSQEYYWFNLVSTLRALEVVLARGEISEMTLEGLQHDLQQNMEAISLAVAIRGERAGFHRVFSYFFTNKATLYGFTKKWYWGCHARLPENLGEFLFAAERKQSWAFLLRYYTEAIQAMEHPVPQRYHELQKLESRICDQGKRGQIPMFAEIWGSPFSRSATLEKRTRTLLSCAISALAAERYRKTRGRWPRSAMELVDAGLLARAPLDLYNSKPIRFRHTEDGLVVHSVGRCAVHRMQMCCVTLSDSADHFADETNDYDGTALDGDAAPDDPKTPMRYEFHLWDVSQRKLHRTLLK